MSQENTLRITHRSAIGAITTHKCHADHSVYLTAHYKILPPSRRNFSGVGEKQVRPPADFIATHSAGGADLFFAGGGFSGGDFILRQRQNVPVFCWLTVLLLLLSDVFIIFNYISFLSMCLTGQYGLALEHEEKHLA